MAMLKQLEHLKISLDVIKLATNSFGPENFIGVGGFGKVYKADITCSDGLTKTVAIKRLDRRHGQGEHEFLMEIMMLSRYRHKNLVSLLGFCDEGDEKILVYEYEFNGSLDKYLSSNTLAWAQRLKICIGAAQGLEFLHNPVIGTQQRVLHRDVKSANVLLDQFWEAKIADFGLSKIGPANQEFTFLVSNAVGTFGYCDPLYAETNILTKESDVYSFGAVLFEVLCGRLCIGKPEDKHPLLTKLAQHSYEQGTLDDIIFHGLREQMEPNSLRIYSSVAYRCLRREREERPTMDQVLEELDLALEYQESFQSGKPMEYEEIIQMAVGEHPLVYRNKRELKLLLSSGILVDGGRRWFSLSKNKHNCEMISASEFSFKHPNNIEWVPHRKSRFSEVAKTESAKHLNIEVNIETTFLTPGITYAAYLVFKKFEDNSDDESDDDSDDDSYDDSDTVKSEMPCKPIFVGLKYKFKDVGEKSVSYLAEQIDNEWMLIELCQFVSDKEVAKLEVSLKSIPVYRSILLEGIQFLPVEMDINKEPVVQVDISNTRVDTEQKLPSDYLDIIKMAKDGVPPNITDKEIYMLLSKGILTKNGQMFFSLNEDGIKCCMLAARAVVDDKRSILGRLLGKVGFRWISLQESRFGKVAKCRSGIFFNINCHINSHMLSPNTNYATYIVYKLPEEVSDDGRYEYPLQVKVESDSDSDCDDNDFSYSWEENDKLQFIFLSSPKTPLITPTPAKNQRLLKKNPLHRPKVEGTPGQRKDGWMEAQIWAFTTHANAATTTSTINKKLELGFCNYKLDPSGLIVQGIDIRPK